MSKNRAARNKITGYTLLFILLQLPPILGIFNKPALFGGIPVLFAYIFFVWAGFILLVAFHIHKTDN
jgi:hypothetical protein